MLCGDNKNAHRESFSDTCIRCLHSDPLTQPPSPLAALLQVGCAFTTSSWGGGREVKEIYVDGELRWSKVEGAENDIFRRLKERVREIEEEEVG